MTLVLVVDDDPVQRELMSELLEIHDFDVIEAENGQEGVDRAREHMPDVILMDVRMPVMGGNEATRTLKGDEKTRGIPVIVITTGARDVDREAAFSAGCDDYGIKPLSEDELLQKIRNLIPEAADGA